MLVAAGVEERVIYEQWEWEPFVRALRPGDEAAVADLRVFGSRAALGKASEEIAAQQAALYSAATGVAIDHPTLHEVQRTESLWAGQRSMGSRKRAKQLSARGHAAYREQLKA